ncbi:hypothetical protein FWJ25_00615 [Marinobacter salinexigens]|uniref:Uncharacterized protein n=2 Tax=Marinobacter salinexigens TaxID=2919747 RepID=A0A5B0VQ50_9GAMM|nr:hypothetical protein FWJ25_00615 [Marinobacter salinexigens]
MTQGMFSVVCLVLCQGVVVTASSEELLAIEPMSQEQLEWSSGRQGIPMQWQLNESEQNALVTGNTLSGPSETGDNRISDNAFGNMSGIATVIQNTGNQVVIQDSTQVNILINR